MKEILDQIRVEQRELTDKELDAIYIYLSMEYDNMSKDEKDFWLEILGTFDKNFLDDYEDKGSGPE